MKKAFITAIIISMLLGSGCAAKSTTSQTALGVSEIGTAPSDSRQDSNKAIDTPPIINLETTTGEIASLYQLDRGGYEWTYPHGNETATVIADSPSPQQLIDGGYIKAVICPEELAGNPKVILHADGVISKVFFTKDGVDTNAEFTESGVIIVPRDVGKAVFTVSVSFPQGHCAYHFMTDIKSDNTNSGSSDTSASVPPNEQSSAGYNPSADKEPVSISFDNEYGLLSCPAALSKYSWSSAAGIGITVITDIKQLNDTLSVNESCIYDDKFFSEKALIAFNLEESSGSIGYEFLGISEDYEIVLRRTVPEVGTCDMVQWFCLIPIPEEISDKSFTIRTITENL